MEKLFGLHATWWPLTPAFFVGNCHFTPLLVPCLGAGLQNHLFLGEGLGQVERQATCLAFASCLRSGRETLSIIPIVAFVGEGATNQWKDDRFMPDVPGSLFESPEVKKHLRFATYSSTPSLSVQLGEM